MDAQGTAGSEPDALADQLWQEHGWSLSGTAVAVLVTGVMALCAIGHVLG